MIRASSYLFFFLLAISVAYNANAQVVSSLKKDSTDNRYTKSGRLILLVYIRGISSTNGSKRADENIVANIKFAKWLRFEPGIRFGERPQHLDSYYHYKLELQTKSFWKISRLIARISDNVVNFPSPSYRKTNEVFAIENRLPIGKRFLCLINGGYVFSAQQSKMPDVLPTTKGTISNYPVFKLALCYFYKKGMLELAYGSYDVFNPYFYNSPFFQLTFDHELSKLCAFYSYFRYQYNNDVFNPANYFTCVGIRFHLVK